MHYGHWLKLEELCVGGSSYSWNHIPTALYSLQSSSSPLSGCEARMKISFYPTILCTLPGLIILHWICKSHWIWQRDICRSEVNHTEIGRAHIWKILNKIYQPYRIYGYPVNKVAPFENAGTWVTSHPASRHIHWVYFEDDESIEESFIHSSAASPDGEVEWW